MKTNNQFEQHRIANAWLMGVVIAVFVLGVCLLSWASYKIGRHYGSQTVKTKIINDCPEYASEDANLLK